MEKQKVTEVKVSVVNETTGKLETKKVSFVKSGWKTYFNAQHLFVQLERGERALFDFLCEHMDSQNRVAIDKDLKLQFRDFLKRITIGHLTYSETSVNTYVHTLARIGLIISAGSKNSGVYFVNPKYVFQGSETDRAACLKSLIEHRILLGRSIEHLINVPVDRFFGRTV
jgi:hypothetical protein